MGRDILPQPDSTNAIAKDLHGGKVDPLSLVKRALQLGFGYHDRIKAGTSPSAAVDNSAALEAARLAEEAMKKVGGQ